MPKSLLAVSRLHQRGEGDCLPTCAQMILGFLGRAASYEELYRLLGTHSFGTPAANIRRLSSLGVVVSLAEMELDAIEAALADNLPVIAFINTADVAYWAVDTDHAVVVIGADEENVYLNDPYHAEDTQRVSRTAFLLAQLKFNNLCAVIRTK